MSNKFGAKRQTVDGISFASQAEAKRYIELKMMERAGKISYLHTQPTFTMPVGNYTPDFLYIDNGTGKEIAEEIKGHPTEAFRLRLRCFQFFYPDSVLLINGVDSRAKKPRTKRKVKVKI